MYLLWYFIMYIYDMAVKHKIEKWKYLHWYGQINYSFIAVTILTGD